MLEKYDVLISTSLDNYKDKILRIGHMVENVQLEYVIYVLSVIYKSLKELIFNINKYWVELFFLYY